MATPRNVFIEYSYPFLPSARRYSRVQVGWNGDHRTPYTYKGWLAVTAGAFQFPNGNWVAIDAPNSTSLSTFELNGGIPDWSQPAYNKAYAKFRDRVLGEGSNLGETFAEWREGLGMVTNRVLQLTRAAKYLNKGNLSGFLGELGVNPSRRHRQLSPRQVARNASGLWLEYWFGWSPTLNDIWSASLVLTRPFPEQRAFGSAADSHVKVVSDVSQYRVNSAHIKHRIGGTVKVTNPNLYLLSQLGLANPVETALAIVPFSWVVDWFVDYSSFIGSFSDFLGVDIIDPYSSSLLRFTDTYQPYPASPGWNKTITCQGNCLIRRTSIPRPMANLQILANLGQSLTRTATAVSLLTQTLTGMRGVRTPRI